jgi:hypothetical protein
LVLALAVASLFAVGLAAPASSQALPTCNSYFPAPWPSFPNAITYVPTYGGSYRCTLRAGAPASAVFVLQGNLQRCANSNVVANGIYDRATRDTILYLQAAEGLTVDGVYGPATAREAMRWAFFNRSTNAFMWCQDGWAFLPP